MSNTQRPDSTTAHGVHVRGVRILRWGAVALMALTLWRWYSASPLDLASFSLVLLALPDGAILSYALIHGLTYFHRFDLKVIPSHLGTSPEAIYAILMLLVGIGAILNARYRRSTTQPFRPALRPVALLLCAVNAAILLTTTADPLKHLVWLAIGALIILQTRDALDEKGLPVSIRNDILSATLLAVSCTLSLLTLEAGMWILHGRPDSGRGIYQFHPDYLFLSLPNSATQRRIKLAEGGYHEVTIEVGPQGFRNPYVPPKSPGEFRILILGDSFTMGDGVEDHETVPFQLQSLFAEHYPDRHITVVNGGLNGAGPVQEFGMLVERGLPLEPDAVILQLLPGNDLENSLAVKGKFNEAYEKLSADGVLFHRGLRQGDNFAEYWLANHSHAYNGLRNAYAGRHFLRDLLQKNRFMHWPPTPRLPHNAARPFYVEANLAEWYPALHEGLDILAEYVLQMQDICESRQIGFSAYCMPGLPTLHDGQWQSLMESMEGKAEYIRFKEVRAVEERLRRDGIPLIDVFTTLSALDELGDYFYLEDGHCKPKGNGLIAEVLFDHLQETYFQPQTEIHSHTSSPSSQRGRNPAASEPETAAVR